MFFSDLWNRLTVTSLPRLASARTLLMPSPLPNSQILASTGWLVIGQTPTCSSYQIVLKMNKNQIRKTVFDSLNHLVCFYVPCLSISRESLLKSKSINTRKHKRQQRWRKATGPHQALGSCSSQSLEPGSRSSREVSATHSSF